MLLSFVVLILDAFISLLGPMMSIELVGLIEYWYCEQVAHLAKFGGWW